MVLDDPNGFDAANDLARLESLVLVVLDEVILQVVGSKLLHFYLLPSPLVLASSSVRLLVSLGLLFQLSALAVCTIAGLLVAGCLVVE